jgi:Chaperone of endosialidase
MSTRLGSILTLAASATLAAAALHAGEPPRAPLAIAPPAAPPLERPQIPAASVSEETPASGEEAVALASGTTLNPPVTISYGGSSKAVTITDSGTNRGLSSSLTNSGNGNSAVYGETKGSGAGVKGISSGAGGTGGIFQVTSSSSAQPALSASTAGTGSAIEAASGQGTAILASSESGTALMAHSSTGAGLYAASDTSFGVFGESTNYYGVIGVDFGNGKGVYGYSRTGYAGYFAGTAAAFSFVSLSDRNAKTDFAPVDGAELLERVAALPVTSWQFKTDPARRHIGPTAQDFHAAFGFNGDDDTHISLTDAAGVSLAAIKELNRRLDEKDAQLKTMQTRIARLERGLSGSAQDRARER